MPAGQRVPANLSRYREGSDGFSKKIYHVESTSCEKWRFGARGPGRESVGRSGKVPGYFGKGETVMDEPIIIIILPPDTWL